MPKVTISHPDKVIYPADNITKEQIAAYYQLVSKLMLPLIADRPLTLQRFPHGIAGDVHFFQKNVPDYFPDWIERLTVANKSDTGSTRYVICNNISTLLYLVNEGCLTFHAWLSKKNNLDYPDRLIIDLDPGSTRFSQVKQVAQDLRILLEQVELTPFIMTTGSQGLHIVVPLDAQADFATTRAFIQQLLRHYQEQHSRITTMEMHIEKRAGKIFLDSLRNAFGQTGVAPYSLRPYPGAPIATPLHWEELDDPALISQRYTLTTIAVRLRTVENPWRNINRYKGSIVRAAKLLASGIA
ncbi:non-homologous end-joining DNA ligase [Candidatus Dependentiae bacterium]|nr:non-homologous end-joining DNA ligase [Candidatus Dependentiae bacterium]